MILNELQGQRLSAMDANTRYNTLLDTWSALKFICGAILYNAPEEGEFDNLGMQLETLRQFIETTPAFMRLTRNEILHAFYLNNARYFGDQVRHYQQPLNPSFVGEVLSAYVTHKVSMYDRSLGAIRSAMMEKQPTPVVDAGDVGPMIARDYAHYLAGEPELIWDITRKYIYLRRCGGILLRDRTTFYSYIRKAMEHRKVTRKDLRSMYELVQQHGIIDSSEYRVVVLQARRFLYLRFMEVMAAMRVPLEELEHRPENFKFIFSQYKNHTSKNGN